MKRPGAVARPKSTAPGPQVNEFIYGPQATLRIEPLNQGTIEARLCTLHCPHGVTEAETTNPDDGEVLAYAAAYHTTREGCLCAEQLFERLSGTSRRAERRV
jgi:hypothetical protein